MNRLSIAALSLASLAGLAANAASARADDVFVGFGVGSGGGFFGGFGAIPPRPVRPPHGHAPAPIAYPVAPYGPARADACGCREVVPAHDVVTEETVCVPAVYEDRVVPVMKTVCVPIFREVCVPEMREVTVPVFEERCVPVMGVVVDPRTGRRHAVKVGEEKRQVQVGVRVESVKVGEHREQVKVGERKERVQVGERVQHVLVRRETTRVVPRVEHVPARAVTVVADGMPVAGPGLVGEVITRSQFEAEMALVRGVGFAGARR